MSERARSLLGRTGFLVGAAIGVLALLGWRLPHGDPPRGAAVQIQTGHSNELLLDPGGPLVSGPSLHPGDPSVQGTLWLRNQTGETRKVRARISAEARDLDRLLQIEVASRSVTLYRGPLAGLRSWSAGSFSLPSHRARALTVRVWLPAGLAGGYEHRNLDGALELLASSEGRL